MTAKKKLAAKTKATIVTGPGTLSRSNGSVIGTVDSENIEYDAPIEVPADYEETAMAKAVQSATPLERVRAGNAFNNAMISQGDFQLAAGALDGSFFYVAGSHKIFAFLERVFPATGHGTVNVVDPGHLQEEIVDLIRQLRESKAAMDGLFPQAVMAEIEEGSRG